MCDNNLSWVELVQVMPCCRLATGHNMSQYWPRSMSPYSVIGPHWVVKRSSSCLVQHIRWMYIAAMHEMCSINCHASNTIVWAGIYFIWRLKGCFKVRNNNFLLTCWYAVGSLTKFYRSLQWRYNELDGASNHRHLDCLPSRLFRRRSKKKSKLRVTGLCGDRWIPLTKGQ